MAVPARAASEEEYAECLLKYQKRTRNDKAAAIVESACRTLYREFHVLFAKEVALQQCLLDNVPDVESAEAVDSISSACYIKNK